MRIEERLREAATQVPATWPGEAYAYQRFLRRRRRARRLLVTSTGAAFVAMLGLALLVPSTLGGSAPAGGPAEAGQQTLARPRQGFELRLSPGWEAKDMGGGDVVLSYRTRTRQTVHMTVRTSLSADKRVNGGVDTLEMTSPMVYVSPGYSEPAGRRSYHQRPDGRTVLKAEQRGINWAVDYQVAWPYACPAGAPCPKLARARVLDFEVTTLAIDWPEVRPLVERMVDQARPVGNAAGEPTPLAGRPACRGDDVDDLGGGLQSASADVVELVGGAVTRYGLPCHYHKRLALVVTVNGRRADIEGNGAPVTLDAAMPEGAPGGQGVAAVRWRWTNWCGGGRARVEVVDLDRPGGGQDLEITPRCTDRSRPSVIRVERRLSD